MLQRLEQQQLRETAQQGSSRVWTEMQVSHISARLIVCDRVYIALAGLELLVQHPKCYDHRHALRWPAFSLVFPHLQVSVGVVCHVAPEEFP